MQLQQKEPPKFKHKRVPKAAGSPPVPAMRSPPRSVAVKDQQDWKIPPCISNWKNPKGYTIPLDKQKVQINDNFAKLSDVTEQKGSEAVQMRSKIQRELGMANTKTGEGEIMYDRRLPNQEQGTESGFDADDAYNVNDKGLFSSQNALRGLYRPRKDEDFDVYRGADEQLDKLKPDRFRAHQGFAGASERSARDGPLEFEGTEEADPFGLDFD